MRCLSLSVLLVFLAATGYGQEPPPAQVRTVPVVKQEVAKNKAFLGVLYYDKMSMVASEVAGLVETVHIKAGQQVKKGEILVQLNTDLLDKDIQLSKTRVEQQRLQGQLAKKDFDRQKTLLKTRGASQKNYDDAQFALSNSQLEKQVAQRTLERLLLQKEKSHISAPFDGVVLEKNVASGDWVQQGGMVASIGATDALLVKIPVGETLLQFIEEGSEVDVTINAFGNTLKGTVDSLAPRADAKTKNVLVKVRIPKVENGAENMSATVYLPVSTKQQLSILPRDALIKFKGKDFVYTVKEGKATILPVNIVTFLGDKVAADNPYLAPGMPVVVEGNERLRPDQPVTVIKE
ncbi:MAG: efflux transporter periplasmic adaptor subunit [Deltaproteobacteria bacterium]|nr:MAG: efflux transporter periplasmic adaptor subunit [Deltaproteobacteria bacterium]